MKRKVGILICKILGRIVIGILAIILGIDIYVLYAEKICGNKIPTPFGIGSAVVLTGSMHPEFDAGDLVIVKKYKSENPLEKGEIVVYQDENDLVIHRVVKVEDGMVTTQGDANNAADDPFKIEYVRAVYLFRIRRMGTFISVLKKPVCMLLLVIIIILLIEIPFVIQKAKDEKKTQAIEEEIAQLKAQMKNEE